jgi:hypothetical protein
MGAGLHFNNFLLIIRTFWKISGFIKFPFPETCRGLAQIITCNDKIISSQMYEKQQGFGWL